MYLQHFGLKHDPLGKTIHEALENEQYLRLKPHLDWLLETRGVGMITGEAGVGKTTGIRQWVKALNPLTHRVFYQVGICMMLIADLHHLDQGFANLEIAFA